MTATFARPPEPAPPVVRPHAPDGPAHGLAGATPEVPPPAHGGLDLHGHEIGRHGAAAAGAPTLVVVAALHGNEPAGIHAARRVLARLARDGVALRGSLVALAGNLPALAARRRFIDHDLNRAWTPERVAAAADPTAAPLPDDAAENATMRALYGHLAAAMSAAGGPVHVLDLHTTSSRSAPFVLFADTLRNRAFARAFPLPMVLGLEEQIEGAMLNHLVEQGCVCVGVEGGQHDAPAAVDNLEALLWLALAHLGMLPPHAAPDLAACRDRLVRARGDVPPALEVRYRHAIGPADAFRMAPGYANFQPVAAGEAIASDRCGAVRAAEAGRILMPLYQGQGEDGFFMTRAIDPRWLDVSTALRQLRVCRLLPLLPGVRRHPVDRATLVVDTRVARWFPLQVFHLLGYRRRRWDGARLVVSRRGHDGA